MVTFVSPRVQKKRKKLQKILMGIVIVVCIAGIGWGALFVSGFLDTFHVALISPISGVSFSKTPTEEIRTTLTKANIAFETIYTASQSAYVVRQKEGAEIILTSSKDIKLQVATLQLILSKLTIEGKSLSRVDLRFDKPIVVFK